MTVLADVRANVRIDLKDTDANNYRWTDSEIDRNIQRALRRFSYAWPQEIAHTIACVALQREYDIVTGIAAMANLMAVREVEHPSGQYPKAFVRFTFSPPKTLTLLVDPPPQAGESLIVHADLFHVVDVASCTVPGYLLEIVENGAAGFASQEWATYAINRVNVDAQAVRNYRQWGSERLTLFYRDLKELQRKRIQPGRSTAAFTGYTI